MSQILKTIFYPGFWIYSGLEQLYGDGDTENNSPDNPDKKSNPTVNGMLWGAALTILLLVGIRILYVKLFK